MLRCRLCYARFGTLASAPLTAHSASSARAEICNAEIPIFWQLRIPAICSQPVPLWLLQLQGLCLRGRVPEKPSRQLMQGELRQLPAAFPCMTRQLGDDLLMFSVGPEHCWQPYLCQWIFILPDPREHCPRRGLLNQRLHSFHGSEFSLPGPSYCHKLQMTRKFWSTSI